MRWIHHFSQNVVGVESRKFVEKVKLNLTAAVL